MKRISATEAARNFSDVLDRVEHRGEEFVVERNRRPVAKIAAAGTGGRRFTGADLRRLLDDLGGPDPRFAADVRRARRELNKPPRDPWRSSSIRRS